MLKKQAVRGRHYLAGFCLLGISLLAIAALTLFPFDFFIVETWNDFSWSKLIEGQPKRILLNEFVANIALFVPLGFSIAQLLLCENTTKRIITSLFVTIAISFVVTLSVESLQIFLPSRSATFSDLLANTAGGGVGCGLWWLFSPLIGRLGQRLVNSLRWIKAKRIGRLMAAVGLGIYCCFTLSATAANDHLYRWSFNNWESDYPLMLGNEASGDRPWSGRINSVQIYSQSLEPADIKALLARSSNALNESATVASYQFSGLAPYADRLGHLPDLVWHCLSRQNSGQNKNSRKNEAIACDSPPVTDAQSSVSLSLQHWLQTKSAPVQLTRGLRASNAFTIGLSFITDNNTQDGPARILSLSKDPFNRNLTIGQVGPHLNLRVRSPLTKANGRRPEFVVPNIFSQVPTLHHLVLTYSTSRLAVYLDSFENSHVISLSPEATFFWQLSPPFGSTIHLSSRTTQLYKWLYRILFVIPIGGFLALATPPRLRQRQLLIFVCTGILLPCILLEIFLGSDWWSFGYMLISLSVALLIWLLLVRNWLCYD